MKVACKNREADDGEGGAYTLLIPLGTRAPDEEPNTRVATL